ncbi:hypothetical protein [Paraburkholderia largidicola]|uniref:Lipoprotein n=1 Tax=Paraburkholderia largidicola TaxID=3014751 RepID=A0A7I8C4I1_9BURK|nr:hypothetical protein [Paraburkholderia sp. PGU16]BCF95389.1 hypothetical protein PPGU16_84560 [Paraburkholderia sp. PGU16]
MIKTLVIGALALSIASAACAYDRGAHAGWQVHQPARFIVSGVLRKDGTADVIKPIHAIETADTADAAVAAFSRSAGRQYPGYTLIGTLASPVPPAGTCESSI